MLKIERQVCRHWLFVLATVFACSEVGAAGVRGTIDQFVQKKAEEIGVRSSPMAAQDVLIRRLSFDLTGLPPGRDLYQRHSDLGFEAGFDSIVESFLNSPQFGERMASMWMNVARYAEDQAHQVGNDTKHFYPNAYLYRQWVVDAFNSDLPYDEFVRLQLAGDLYETTSEEDIPALGFLGLGPKYYNRGRLDVKADEWEDRVDTVTRGFLGLTVACARCHDHKFDPIPTEDYYALAGVFASTEMVNAPYGKPEAEWTEEDKKQARHTVHIVKEGKPQDLNVFIRGNVERKGDLVPRRFLSLFYSNEEEIPQFTQGSGRRELAEAIVANPLAPKVYVNRVWQQFFGRGIVGTPSNFGALGDEPTHPELLEYLADQFVEHGWSTKWLVREIVSSATYRQSSAIVTENQEKDPDNLYLWRMARRRLSVEAWRDTLLALGENLDQEKGRSLRLDDPENHRRTLYGRVSRLKLNPVLVNGDYPDANVHSGKRAVTTTPIQKLYALNSEFVMEQAGMLTKRLDRESLSDVEWIQNAYRLLFFREVTASELDLGLEFMASEDIGQRKLLYAQALLTSNELSYLD